VHPENGCTGALLIESGKPMTQVPPTPEDIEEVRADLERRRAARLLRREAPLTRTITRRLEQLETRAKEVAAARPEPQTLCFISVDKKVVNTFEIGTGKRTYFDPPRDRAEFEPMV
jgi:hypothetical protein